MRRTLAKAVAGARRFPKVATTFAQAFPARQAADAVQAAVEAIGLGAYRFDRYKKRSDEPNLTRATVLVQGRVGRQGGVEGRARRAEIVAEAVCWARDLVNTPAGDMPPAAIAKRGAGDGEGGRPDVQGLDRAAAGAGRLRRDPRRGQGSA